ncbi:Hemin transport system permease protein HmuU [Nocardia cerradoensis]|uniref:Hemin transport system permease protein HmuU n=1 Tax=Nocardia cerradoensis TaxID=85688 RepID=A0A231H1A5_9NOCA|nr:Hemin transport system permease protein HmuU [Nocardia cerradoensis]
MTPGESPGEESADSGLRPAAPNPERPTESVGAQEVSTGSGESGAHDPERAGAAEHDTNSGGKAERSGPAPARGSGIGADVASNAERTAAHSAGPRTATGSNTAPEPLISAPPSPDDPDTGEAVVGPRTPRRWSRITVVFAVSIALLVMLALISAAVGQVPTTPLEVAGSVLHRIGLDWGPMPHHPAGEVTLWEVRFPRVVLAMLVGAALATAGALLQGVFANPLAEPGVIGVSAGAAVGAGVVIVVGGAFAAAWSVAGGAFVAGLGTTLAVYLLSRSGGRTETVTLVLTGVAVNAFAGGLMSFLLFTASPAARDQIVFWQMGSLNGATWQAVAVVAPLAAVGVAAAIVMAPRLDLLALGESAARHLGVDVERLRRNVIVVVAILATAGVAFTGIILFVGLIVPHVVRMLVGPAHRVLIPLSAILGAVVLLAADIGARTLVHNADLPLGMLTSLVGGPFFFWLLRRTRARSGGWA